MDDRTRRRIDAVIIDTTGIDPAKIKIDSSLRDCVELDSMQFIQLMAQLEVELDTDIPVKLMQVSTLGEFYDGIQTALHSNDSPA